MLCKFGVACSEIEGISYNLVPLFTGLWSESRSLFGCISASQALKTFLILTRMICTSLLMLSMSGAWEASVSQCPSVVGTRTDRLRASLNFNVNLVAKVAPGRRDRMESVTVQLDSPFERNLPYDFLHALQHLKGWSSI